MLRLLLALSVVGLACSTPSSGPVDSGSDGGSADAGIDAGVDAGADAGTDAGVDAGPKGPIDDGGTVLAHAHNDYEHLRPLFDALDQRFDSVEADIWLNVTDIGVSHNGPPFKGSLKALYLDPLKARLDGGTSVNGDGRPFYLWLDFKDGTQGLQDLVATQLAEYPDMLTRFNDQGVEKQGPVTVVLTGNTSAKTALVNRPSPRLYIRDADGPGPADPPADGKWGYYATNYFFNLTWIGEGNIPPGDRVKLRKLASDAHALGRKIRVYASPQSPAYWREASDAGIDFLNVDDLKGLRAFLDGKDPDAGTGDAGM